MTASLFFASDVSVVDVIVTRKRELSQVKSQIFVVCTEKKFPDKLSLVSGRFATRSFRYKVVSLVKYENAIISRS